MMLNNQTFFEWLKTLSTGQQLIFAISVVVGLISVLLFAFKYIEKQEKEIRFVRILDKTKDKK